MSEAQSYRLLIADDHPLFRGALREAVTGLFREVDIAEAGTFEEVTELAERGGDVDLILLDLAMPTITGFEGAKAFRKAANTRDAILVAFSGMITEDEQARFRRIGFDEVLPKPVAAIALVQRIEGFIARRRAAESSEA